MTISICSISRRCGALTKKRIIIGNYACTRITGKTLEGSLICTIIEQISVKNGTRAIKLWSTKMRSQQEQRKDYVPQELTHCSGQTSLWSSNHAYPEASRVSVGGVKAEA